MSVAQPSRAELTDRKRRLLSDYLVAGEEIVRSLGDPDHLPAAEEVAPLLGRREAVISTMADLDCELAETAASDPAAEIVAENALHRALESSAELDGLIGTALISWQVRVAASLTEVGIGRKTLKAYSSGAAAARRVVDEAA